MYRYIIIIIAIVSFSGCAQSYLTSYWYNKSYTQVPIPSMLVVALSDHVPIRRLFEDDLTQKLRKVGTKGYSSGDLLNAKEPTKENIIQLVKNQNIATILTAKIVNVQNKSVYYPPTSPYRQRYYFDNYYSAAYLYAYDPGYTVSYQYISIEFNLFDARNGNVIWAATSETIDPQKLNSTINELTDIIIDNLKASHLIN